MKISKIKISNLFGIKEINLIFQRRNEDKLLLKGAHLESLHLLEQIHFLILVLKNHYN